ncbi:MAG: hypothetical protein IPH44_19570 [Myxococcales bacterium]|nr:hypothetical protein [Myxococcales bacterium]
MRSTVRLLVVALLAVVACYQPADQPCSIHCTPLDHCPGDQTCGGDGYCHDPGDDSRCVGYTVAITLGGTGAGVVRSSPPGLACDGATGCVATFAAGTELTLTAAPAADARLSAWSGACSGADGCTLTVAGDVAVGATFNRAARLAVTLDPDRRGQGAVVSTPPGIDCPGVACAASFDVDQSVVLTATAAAGSRFGAWSACPAAVDGACTVSLTGDAATTVQFVRTPRVTVDVVGSADFAIGSSPAGVTCAGATCAGVFDHGTAVTITAGDGAASRWKGWTGCGAAAGPCTVTVDAADVALTATYRDLFVLDALVEGSGAGAVAATGLICAGATCAGTYEAGASVTITATPTVGSRFAGWTGCDSVGGAGGAQCVVAITGARAVRAGFVRQRQVTLDLTGSGAGSVDVAGVGACSADCTLTVDQGPITLTQAPAAGSRGGGFAGACTSAGPTCTTAVAADATVAVAFVRQHTLTITAAADVTVTSPAGPCVGPATCAAVVDLGATVTLTAATALLGQAFTWSAACAGASCPLTVAADLAVTVGLDGGRAIWGRALARPDTYAQEHGAAVAVAPDGDVVWAGFASGGAALPLGGAPTPVSTPFLTAFVARYGADGTPRWARAMTTSLLATVRGACVTPSGDVIVGGEVNGTTTLDGATVVGVGRNDGYVARLDGATGTAEWMVTIGGSADHPFYGDGVWAVACLGEDVAALYTVLGPSYRVADGPVVTGAPTFAYGVARLSAAGHYQWARQVTDVPDGSYNAATALAADATGVHVVGSYSNVFDPGGGPIAPTFGHPSGFAVRYRASDGSPLWTRSIGNNTEQGAGDTGRWARCEVATVAGDGTLAIGGYLEGSDGDRANLGALAAPQRVTVRGNAEMFVLRLASVDGAAVGSFALGSSAASGDERLGALVAAGAELVVRGTFTTAAVEVGGRSLAGGGSAGSVDGFVARLSLAGTARWAHQLGPFASQTPTPTAVAPTGEVAVAGAYTGDPVTYDGVDLPASGQGVDGFVMLLGR